MITLTLSFDEVEELNNFIKNSNVNAEILGKLMDIQKQGDSTMAAIDDLTAEVTRNRDVEKSALALIQGFAAQLAAAGTDPAKLADLRAQLQANDDELAAAVVANTPAAPPAA